MQVNYGYGETKRESVAGNSNRGKNLNCACSGSGWPQLASNFNHLILRSWGTFRQASTPNKRCQSTLTYILVNCLSDAPVAPTSLSSYCFAMRKNTAGHSFLSARMYIQNLKDSLLVFFRRVN